MHFGTWFVLFLLFCSRVCRARTGATIICFVIFFDRFTFRFRWKWTSYRSRRWSRRRTWYEFLLFFWLSLRTSTLVFYCFVDFFVQVHEKQVQQKPQVVQYQEYHEPILFRVELIVCLLLCFSFFPFLFIDCLFLFCFFIF